MGGFDYNAYARYRQAVESGAAPPLGPPQGPAARGAQGPQGAALAAPAAGPSPYGEITAPKGFLARVAERAAIPTTDAGWSDPTRAGFGVLGALLAPRPLLGETIDTIGEQFGRQRPVAPGHTTPGGTPSFSLGQMAEYGTPLRAFPVTTPGAAAQALRGTQGVRNYMGAVREGIEQAGVEGRGLGVAGPPSPYIYPQRPPGAGARPKAKEPLALGPGRPIFALPEAAGPSGTGSVKRVPGFATSSGARGPDVELRRRPPVGAAARPTEPFVSSPLGRGMEGMESASATRADSETLGRQVISAAEPPPTSAARPGTPGAGAASDAELEPAAEFINRHRGLLNGPSLAQFVQLSNQYNRAPEPDKQRIMLAMFKLVRTAAAGVPTAP